MAGLTLAAAVTATAGTSGPLRCNGDLILQGDSILAVKRACGEPVREQKVENKFGARIGTELYYKGGYGQRDRRVILIDGKVERVELLD
jgi:hypothetical protein